MEESGWSLCRRFVPAAACARFNVEVNILLNSWPVILRHEGTASLVDTKVIKIVVVQIQEFLAGYTIIGGDTETIFKEKETISELVRGVLFGVRDDWREECILRI
jgi:hypothetical protein